MRESDSQDVLFSLVNYHHFHSWLVSVGKYITVTKACIHGQNQISSQLGLIWSDAVTQSILKDEKAVAQGVLKVLTVGYAGVYDLRDDNANNFLNLLQEVRKLMFCSSYISKCVVFGSIRSIPSLERDRRFASFS
jgi:hypothetical protein